MIDDTFCTFLVTPVTPTATPAEGGDSGGGDDSGGTVNNSGDNNSTTATQQQQQQPPSNINNNSLPKEVSVEELELLKKLEAANR